MAQAFGCLFRCSGRWECELDGEQFTFNTACTDRDTLMAQTGLYIPEGWEDMPNPNISLNELEESDRQLFMA